MNTTRHIWLAAGAVCAVLIGVFVAMPIISAESRYDDAYARIDHRGQCMAAQEAAAQWAKLGPMGRMKFWTDKASSDCWLVSLEAARG